MRIAEKGDTPLSGFYLKELLLQELNYIVGRYLIHPLISVTHEFIKNTSFWFQDRSQGLRNSEIQGDLNLDALISEEHYSLDFLQLNLVCPISYSAL